MEETGGWHGLGDIQGLFSAWQLGIASNVLNDAFMLKMANTFQNAVSRAPYYSGFSGLVNGYTLPCDPDKDTNTWLYGAYAYLGASTRDRSRSRCSPMEQRLVHDARPGFAGSESGASRFASRC